MTLYHGGITEVITPLIITPNRPLDFSVGFYTTTEKLQAEQWAKSKQEKAKKQDTLKNAIISVYECNDNVFYNNFIVKIFEQTNNEWLDFIVKNRKNIQLSHQYDIVKGPVANDTLFRTINFYEEGIYTKEETVLRLKSHALFDQISFHTKRAIDELFFTKSYAL